jgi:2-keto-4-pentenoate hydratase/2-oxohepta-3-ene-1,7-dioic acid hydratase in catechol pathway
VTITGVGYKILPTFSPILTRYIPRGAEVDYENLKVTATVDGETAVEEITAHLAFTIPELVAHTSRIVRLQENDVIALGDPGNVRKYLDDASSVTCSIESIGELTNSIRRLE